MESQGISNSQSNPEKEQSWRFQTSLYQNSLQSYSNQNSETGMKTNIETSGI